MTIQDYRNILDVILSKVVRLSRRSRFWIRPTLKSTLHPHSFPPPLSPDPRIRWRVFRLLVFREFLGPSAFCIPESNLFPSSSETRMTEKYSEFTPPSSLKTQFRCLGWIGESEGGREGGRKEKGMGLATRPFALSRVLLILTRFHTGCRHEAQH